LKINKDSEEIQRSLPDNNLYIGEQPVCFYRLSTGFLNLNLRDDIRKKKSKKQEFGPLSVDPYPPTIKREVLIRDNFDFFLPPTLLIEKGTFLKKNSAPKHIYSNFKRDEIGVKIIFHPFHLNLLSRGHNNGNKM